MSCKKKMAKNVSFETFLMECTSMDRNVCSVIASFFVLLEIKSEFQTVGAIGYPTENIKKRQFPSVDIIPYQSFMPEKGIMIVRYAPCQNVNKDFEDVVELNKNGKNMYAMIPSESRSHKLDKMEWTSYNVSLCGRNYYNININGTIRSIRMSSNVGRFDVQTHGDHVCGNLMYLDYSLEVCCLCGSDKEPVGMCIEGDVYGSKTLCPTNTMSVCLKCQEAHGFGKDYDRNVNIFKSLGREYGDAFIREHVTV